MFLVGVLLSVSEQQQKKNVNLFNSNNIYNMEPENIKKMTEMYQLTYIVAD